MSEYAVVITPIKEEDGGGYLGRVPDLAGCISEGDSMEEALANTLLAIDEWLDEAKRRGMEIPVPGCAAARHRKNREAMIDAFTKINDVEDRIQDIEVTLRDLREQAEDLSSWTRFASLTGLPIPADSEAEKTARC